MKNKVAFRKFLNNGLLSVISALGITSVPAHANVPEESMPSTDNGDDYPFSDWVNDNPQTEYGCPSATFKFKGTVTDDAGNPIPNVDVVVKLCEYAQDYKEKTDENGEYNISFERTPWCDLTISFTKDPATILDTTIVEADMVFENPSGSWNYGEYSREVNVVFSDQQGGSKIIFNKSALSDVVDLEEPMFRVVNLVEDFMWFTFRSVKSADVTVYDQKGTLLREITLNDGEHLYVGDLKPGTYILTAVSGKKRFSTLFTKK